MTLLSMLMFMSLAWIIAGSWIIGETYLIFMVMRVSNKNFINVHNDHKCKHCDNHSKWEITITMKVASRCGMLIRLIKI